MLVNEIHLHAIMKCPNQSTILTSQKCVMTSFELNIGQKRLRFRKATSANLKIEKLPVTLAT